ncbi:hypothetical protein acdb102_24380 [Acidothermaceae bacterium B102]|nr:hypothetical protein acdb102_24380 [Acidothermaceae bacterium B102]
MRHGTRTDADHCPVQSSAEVAAAARPATAPVTCYSFGQVVAEYLLRPRTSVTDDVGVLGGGFASVERGDHGHVLG